MWPTGTVISEFQHLSRVAAFTCDFVRVGKEGLHDNQAAFTPDKIEPA